jgi:hypothetical protein
MTPYRKPAARPPRWAIALGYEGGPPIDRGGSSTRRFLAILWTSVNLVAIAVASIAAYIASVSLLVDGGLFSARTWFPAAALRGGACVALALGLAIGLYPVNAIIFRWIYRPERARQPGRLFRSLVLLVAVASLIGLAQSAAAHAS